MDINKYEDIEFDFTETSSGYVPDYTYTEEDDTHTENKNKDESSINKIKQFFTKKNTKNKKFMLYDDGTIKYIDNSTQPDSKNYEDVINKSSNKLKERVLRYEKQDFFRFFLILYLIMLAIVFYKYYYNPTASTIVDDKVINDTQLGGIKSDSSIQKAQKNKNDKYLNIEKPEPLEGTVNKNSSNTEPEKYYSNLENEIAKYNNENIKNVRLYFNNRFNRGALKTSLESNLEKQKNLYIHIESNHKYYSQHYDLNKVLDTLLSDIVITSELLEQLSGKFTRSNVDNIFKKYQIN